jgi:alkylation response protein AidB-like acyl-CoA dehydrogenase
MGYSEPDYGSDVASIVTRAVRDGDEWVINGAKMWTTMAHKADWLILLTRTNTEVPKHKGLTMFILPMDTPGITVDPVHTMGTERTNATYYDDVRVGDEAVLGDVDGGWRTMTVALSFERGVMGGTNAMVPLLGHFHDWATSAGVLDGPVARDALSRAVIDAQVSALLSMRSAWIAASGGQAGLTGSMTKVFASEAYQRSSAEFQKLAGPAGLLQFHEPGAAAEGFIEYDARHTPVVTIYGGTSEINRNNIAERHLGLPKARG